MDGTAIIIIFIVVFILLYLLLIFFIGWKLSKFISRRTALPVVPVFLLAIFFPPLWAVLLFFAFLMPETPKPALSPKRSGVKSVKKPATKKSVKKSVKSPKRK